LNKKELKFILQEGEGYLIEFKERVANIDKEMVSFANGAGGRIFIGINDNKEIVGITVTNKLKSQIQDIANNCEPQVKIFMEEYENILIEALREAIINAVCHRNYFEYGANIMVL